VFLSVLYGVDCRLNSTAQIYFHETLPPGSSSSVVEPLGLFSTGVASQLFRWPAPSRFITFLGLWTI